MRWGSTGNSGPQHKWQGVDVAEMGSGKLEVLNRHTSAYSSVVKGPAGLPFSHRFSSFLDSYWPVT